MSLQSQAAPPPYEKQVYLTTEKYLDGEDPYYRATSPLPPATPRRRSDESSTAGSDYGVEIKGMMTYTSGAAKALDVFHTKSHINMRIHDESGNCIYYVDNSAFTPGKPDVTLSMGSEKGGQVLGVCRWSNMYSKHLMVGIGDPASNNTTWEEMKAETTIHPEFKWSVTLPSGGRHTFAWQRIHGDDVKAESSDANSASNKNYKLFDCSDPQKAAIAVFASNRYKSWKKLGKFIIKVDGHERGWGENWELMVLLSALGLVEKSRRRGRSRRSQGGSYGP